MLDKLYGKRVRVWFPVSGITVKITGTLLRNPNGYSVITDDHESSIWFFDRVIRKVDGSAIHLKAFTLEQ